MAAKVILMVNVQEQRWSWVFVQAAGLSERARGYRPAWTNFVVCLVAMAQLCVFSPSLSLSLKATLDVVMNLQFHYIEKLWQTFWCATAPSSDGNTTINNRWPFTAAFSPNLTRIIVSFKIVFLVLFGCYSNAGL